MTISLDLGRAVSVMSVFTRSTLISFSSPFCSVLRKPREFKFKNKHSSFGNELLFLLSTKVGEDIKFRDNYKINNVIYMYN